VERYETDNVIWKDKRALMKAQLEAMEEGDKRDAKDNAFYNGWTLFNSEVHIPGATVSDFSTKAGKMWNELTPEKRQDYHEKARKINEKGQGELLASTIKKIKTINYGRPITAPTQFRNHFLSDRLKEAYKEIKRERLELCDKERESYVKRFEVETKLYNAQMVEYRAGEKYARNKRNVKVTKAIIKKIEKEMNKPKLNTHDPYHLFMLENKKYLTGKRSKNASEMWEALTEEEQMEYKAKWNKLNADWKTDVAVWEERNADNPKMTELKVNNKMFETAKKEGSY